MLVLVAAGAVAAGVLGLRADRDGHEDAVIGEVVGIPGGEMRVDKVTYWDESQHMRGMPGMTISDPLPEGYRRFWVDVTMHASSEPGLRYAPETVAVSAAGLSPVVPHWAPEGLGVIVPGAQATVTFMYQVPETIGDVLLTADGASRPVVIPDADGAAGDDHGH